MIPFLDIPSHTKTAAESRHSNIFDCVKRFPNPDKYSTISKGVYYVHAPSLPGGGGVNKDFSEDPGRNKDFSVKTPEHT